MSLHDISIKGGIACSSIRLLKIIIDTLLSFTHPGYNLGMCGRAQAIHHRGFYLHHEVASGLGGDLSKALLANSQTIIWQVSNGCFIDRPLLYADMHTDLNGKLLGVRVMHWFSFVLIF